MGISEVCIILDGKPIDLEISKIEITAANQECADETAKDYIKSVIAPKSSSFTFSAKINEKSMLAMYSHYCRLRAYEKIEYLPNVAVKPLS